ncbi:MAG: DNA repair protein RecN [Fastidiosipilaceae bacterium]|jgi:DNA repair protein RecN (Recombination protein N)|nr:DNA repair protein RecN [Clostridiaceae bacterium]
MLVRLEITNFALIEHVVLETKPGFTVITGETGAGKSLLIGAISAIIGARVNKELVKTGCDKARIEGCFTGVKHHFSPEIWQDLGLDADDEGDQEMLILSREIEAGGRTWCRINGRIVTLSLFRKVGSVLADIHGQNENQALFDVSSHLPMLDLFGGPDLQKALSAWQEQWEAWRCTRQKLAKYGLTEAERSRELDLLQYQINEIRTVAPKKGEEIKLQKHRDLQIHAERISQDLAAAAGLLEGESGANILDPLAEAIDHVTRISTRLEKATPIAEQMLTAQTLLTEAAGGIRDLEEQVEYNPALLEKIDVRLDKLTRIKKKYGQTIEEILTFAEEAEARVNELSQSEEHVAQLTVELAAQEKLLRKRGDELTSVRQAAGLRLAAGIGAELTELGMPGVKFEVAFAEQSPTESGLDAVEFLISTNPGEPLKPLVKIASGGEAARIMLAVKTVLAVADGTPLLIFDEVDAGISGRTSELVGAKLAQLGQLSQVFCVTHTAQIAAMADQQLMIAKQSDDQHTATYIYELNEVERIDEIARLLSGDQAAEYARELAGKLLARSP